MNTLRPDPHLFNPHVAGEIPSTSSPKGGVILWVAAVLAFVLVAGLVGLNAMGTLASGGLGSNGGLMALWGPAVTPTPTKTPTPPLPTPTSFPQPAVYVPTPTPTPSPQPTASPTPTTVSPPAPPPRIVAVARERGIDTSGRYIVVDQDRQRMYIVSGNVLERAMPISSGDPERHLFTPAWVGRVGVYWGTFSARGVSADNAWHLFKAPGGNILIHGVPYTVDAAGRKIYQDLDKLGRTPASRGCIRIRPQDAVWFTEWGPEGVPIVILPYTRHEDGS